MVIRFEVETAKEVEIIDALKELEQVDKNVIKEYFEGILPDIVNFGFKVIFILLMYFVGTRVIKLIRKIVVKSLQKAEVEEAAVRFIESMVKVLLFVILLLIIVTQFGISTTSVVALFGSAGLAIGLAVQGSLSNFAGGVLILMLKPFRVGDYIIEDGHKNEGTVTEIQLFYTKLATVDNKVVVIPNGTLANSSLTNVTHQEKRRVDILVGIAYDSDLKKAKKLMKAILEGQSCRIQEDEVQVFVSDLADSEVTLGGRIWVPSDKYWEVKWDVLENIKLTFDEHGIEIPFQQIDIKIKSNESGLSIK